jgi:hypothetical protein
MRLTIQTNKPSSTGAQAEDGIQILDVHIQDTVFYARGDVLKEPGLNLASASREIGKVPGPVSAVVGDIPGLGTVHLLYYSDRLITFYFVAGGMRGELTCRRMNEWFLEIYGRGPHAFDENGLAELDKARRIKEFFFGKDARIELKSCSIALYCHNSPDLSDTASTSDTYSDFIYGRITRAKSLSNPPRGPEPQNQLSSRYLFGRARGGRQVEVFVEGGKYPSPNNEEAPRLKESTYYREDREVICVKLFFHGSFIRHIAEGTTGGSSDLNLPDLLRKLVRTTLGDGSLPHSFFRVATLESRGLPDSLRPNSAAWERVRRAFLDGVALPRPSTGTEANH